MQLRALHAYVGMLIAPTVLFMALTGLLQIYSLHEDHDGYHAPAALEMLASIHKDQRQAGHHHDDGDDHGGPPPQGPAGAKGALPPAGGGEHRPPQAKHNMPAIWALKTFFALMAAGLLFSTSVGIWMAMQNRLKRRTYLILLAVGTVIPLALAIVAT